MARFLVIDEDIHPSGIELLRKAGTIEIVRSDTPENVLLEKLKEPIAVLMRKGRMTAGLIEGAPNLKIIARHGVGVDSVDLPAAQRRGILVTITGAANSHAVAEYTMAFMLALARMVPAADADMKAGRWSPNAHLGIELNGRVLGLVGLGQIGRLVAERARGFGMEILVVDPLVDAAAIAQAGGSKTEYHELLPRADFLSFHVRLTDATRGMFGHSHLVLAKRGVRIVNTARGGICEEDALLDGLESGVISGVALDTFAQEPLPADHPLRSHPSAILTPHIAGQTEEAMVNMSTAAAESIIDCIEGRRPNYIYEGAT